MQIFLRMEFCCFLSILIPPMRTLVDQAFKHTLAESGFRWGGHPGESPKRLARCYHRDRAPACGRRHHSSPVGVTCVGVAPRGVIVSSPGGCPVTALSFSPSADRKHSQYVLSRPPVSQDRPGAPRDCLLPPPGPCLLCPHSRLVRRSNGGA